jgi:hypothetical protein
VGLGAHPLSVCPPKQKQPGLSTRPSKTLKPNPALSSLAPSARLRFRLRLRGLLLDRALQVERTGRQVDGLGLEQEGIEAAAVVDALDRVGRDAQARASLPQPSRRAERREGDEAGPGGDGPGPAAATLELRNAPPDL